MNNRYRTTSAAVHRTAATRSILQKAKAISVYVSNVLFGHPGQQQLMAFVFDPEFGKKWQPAFQRQFGYRGENLIALLGNGYSRQALVHYGAIDRDFI